ncbi:hypothetical protein HIM_06856 [Hirsutella minnesotensis 3608]|uniref:Uncharacterized protein n=1 Tax=Hirsutella minnesotensis 3608 TaxID=1043627 RepID=A0A0F7ZTU8_9HYPO|nr:hypothetical protein HIM_06856 [Hirsutella minnesotensis 3608]
MRFPPGKLLSLFYAASPPSFRRIREKVPNLQNPPDIGNGDEGVIHRTAFRVGPYGIEEVNRAVLVLQPSCPRRDAALVFRPKPCARTLDDYVQAVDGGTHMHILNPDLWMAFSERLKHNPTVGLAAAQPVLRAEGEYGGFVPEEPTDVAEFEPEMARENSRRLPRLWVKELETGPTD